jgi:ribosome-binding factor A
MANQRSEKVGRLLREILGEMIVTGKLADPRIDPLLNLTRVQVSRDLKHATVFVSHHGEDRVTAPATDALNHAAGYLQAEVARRIRLRETPRLRFLIDSSVADGFRVLQKMRDLS